MINKDQRQCRYCGRRFIRKWKTDAAGDLDYEWVSILDVTHENHDKTDGCGDGDANPGSGRLQAVREADPGEASRGAVPKMPEETVSVSGQPDNVPVYTLIPFERRAGLSAPRTYWTAPQSLRDENCNGCGTGGWKGDLVPDTIWGLCVTPACDIHDWTYAEGATSDDKDRADLTFLANMLFLIDDAAERSFFARLIAPLRRWRAWHYYEVVRYAGNGPFYAARLLRLDE